MSKRDILAIALKVVGAVFLIYGILELPTVIYIALSSRSTVAGTNASVAIATQFTSFGLTLALGACLVFAADGISRLLVREDAQLPASVIQADRRSVFQLALKIIGVVSVVQAVPALLSLLPKTVSVYGQSSLEFGTSYMWLSYWSNLVRDAAMLLIGIYLIWGGNLVSGAKHLVNLVSSGGSELSESP